MGEVETWGNEVREFKNGRGSVGLKVDGEFHNVIGPIKEIKDLRDSFPKGSFIKFKELVNAKGYWDVSDLDSIEHINKSEAYPKEKDPEPEPEPEPAEIVEVEDVKEDSQEMPAKETGDELKLCTQDNIRFLSCFDKAAGIMQKFYTRDVLDKTQYVTELMDIVSGLVKSVNTTIVKLKKEGELK